MRLEANNLKRLEPLYGLKLGEKQIFQNSMIIGDTTYYSADEIARKITRKLYFQYKDNPEVLRLLKLDSSKI
jgi:hypothetical protein